MANAFDRRAYLSANTSTHLLLLRRTYVSLVEAKRHRYSAISLLAGTVPPPGEQPLAIQLPQKQSTMHSVLGPLAVVVLIMVLGCVNGKDQHENCAEWAGMGECDKNPGYMLSNCEDSCKQHAAAALREAEDIKDITSFFDLEAKDIDGQVVKFDQFTGKVTLVTNVASYCGYTESHYNGLVALYNELKDTGVVEILAFPCNQFGKQEPEECPTIKKFAEKKGVEFRMMDKIDVNGPTASKVYKYLKRESGISTITWNFASYFVVGPEGNIQGFNGVEPHELKGTIGELIDKEL